MSTYHYRFYSNLIEGSILIQRFDALRFIYPNRLLIVRYI